MARFELRDYIDSGDCFVLKPVSRVNLCGGVGSGDGFIRPIGFA
jgi:hypothetical protein